MITLSGSHGGLPVNLFCSGSDKKNLNIGDLVEASIRLPKGYSHEISILKKIKYPKNYIFAVYFHDQTDAKLALFSNKGCKPLSVLPLKSGETIDRKFGYFASGSSSKYSKKFKIQDFHIFGSIDNPSNYSKIAAIEWNLRQYFPRKILNEAREIFENYKISKNEHQIVKPFITIDPDDAKDLDDAICIEADNSKNNPGGIILFVGIADVSFFVKPNSIIDEEALKRGNSTYFPDKVIPMLPEDLSNNLCSLKENSPKKAVVVKMQLDHRGCKIKHEFIRGIITVKKNYSYEDFEAYLSDCKTKKKYSVYKRALNILKQSPHLKNRLNLNLAEKKISISSEGYPTKLFEKKSLSSNELIEMMMILANLCVSQTLSQSISKYVSRYHETPDKHALKDLNIFLSINDLATIREKQVTSNSFNELLKHYKNPEKKKLLSNAVLRILPKAKYSDVEAGHFGLNLPLYCHFTSPIRRYADLSVHRSLAFVLKWETDDLDFRENHKAICQIINESEKKSVGAERVSSDRYSALFMSNHIDDYFEGVVSGSSKFCIFIKLKKFPIEGVLLKKYLEFKRAKKKSSFNLGKSKTRNMGLSIGDDVRVKLVSALPYNGSITFSL